MDGRFGLIGRSLVHSYSPRIHAMLGKYEYRLYEMPEENVCSFLRSSGLDGMNVTIPYKKNVVQFIDELSADARAAGSVNTVVRRPDGTLFGDNTDIYGISELIRSVAGNNIAGMKALVLGSGGASAAAVRALSSAGARPVVISRSGENGYSDIEKHSGATLLINATPVGMYPDTGKSPVDLTRLPGLRYVIDMIYNPEKTALLLQADSLGLKNAGGLLMLVAQAARSSELFTGRKLPEDTVASVAKHLAAQIRAGIDPHADLPVIRLLVINGPNLNMLGIREPAIYGNKTYADLVDFIGRRAVGLSDANGAVVFAECFQSNHEGAIVDKIQEAYGTADGIVINPAAYTHTSVAILDALKAVALPAAEVHISDVNSREAFRKVSYAGMACLRTVAGYGFDGYGMAMEFLKDYVMRTGNQ